MTHACLGVGVRAYAFLCRGGDTPSVRNSFSNKAAASLSADLPENEFWFKACQVSS